MRDFAPYAKAIGVIVLAALALAWLLRYVTFIPREHP